MATMKWSAGIVPPSSRDLARRLALACALWIACAGVSIAQETCDFGDKVCVTIAARDTVRSENRQSQRHTAVFSSGPNQPHTCKSGFVWRQAAANDHACVEPAARQRVRQENAGAAENRGGNTCKPGYVWRQANPSDYVCVKPAVRDQAARDNAARDTGERILGRACDRYAQEAVAQFQTMQARQLRLFR